MECKPRLIGAAMPLLAIGLSFSPVKADEEVTLPDALQTRNFKPEMHPRFAGTGISGLTGHLIMPTASVMTEAQGRFSVAAYEVVNLKNAGFLALTPAGIVPVTVNYKVSTVTPMFTIRAGNKTEISIGKNYYDSEASANALGVNIASASGSNSYDQFAFKQVQVLSREKGLFLTLAGVSNTSRGPDGSSFREKTGYVTFSKLMEDQEWSLAYSFSKYDQNENFRDTAPSKDHDYGIGYQKRFSDKMTFAGEYWIGKNKVEGDNTLSLGLTYNPSPKLQLQGGVISPPLGSTNPYFSLSYLTAFGKGKPAEETPAPTSP